MDKSNFMQEAVIYLGNHISKEGLRADISKIVELKNKIGKPRNIKELRIIVGLLNWFRPYLSNLSCKIVTITNKLKNNELKNWKEEDTKCIYDILAEIEKKTLLHHPDFTKPFKLHTDASNYGIDAVLTQENNLIGLYSKKLTKSELNYSNVEKECYAVVKGLIHFKTIVFNSHVRIHTDNMNIMYAKELDNNRYQRWKIILE
jgi:hypothetical protein